MTDDTTPLRLRPWACQGHVARDDDKKVCRHCGTHVDEYHDEPEDCGQ